MKFKLFPTRSMNGVVHGNFLSSAPPSERWDECCCRLLAGAGCECWQLKIVLSGISSLHIINRHAHTPWYMLFNKCERVLLFLEASLSLRPPSAREAPTSLSEASYARSKALFKCESNAEHKREYKMPSFTRKQLKIFASRWGCSTAPWMSENWIKSALS